jgi:predicted nucleotidyltransferase
MTKEEIKCRLDEQKDILEKYMVKSISLFGSYVRGEQKEGSDIDFLVEFKKPTFRNYIGLLSELKEIFGENVDLICRDALKERIKPYILKEAEPVSE